MLANPDVWSDHYDGTPAEQRVLRHYSLSDRIRYLWPAAQAEAAVDRLMAALRGQAVPLPLFWQHLPTAAAFAGQPLDPEALLISCITRTLEQYRGACGPDTSSPQV